MSYLALTRRHLLSAGATLLGGCATTRNTPTFDSATLEPDDPILDGPSLPAPRSFSGDDPTQFHSVLWDKTHALATRGGLPQNIDERARVCIIGGGVAGLSAAYMLRETKPLLLEGAVQLGGNSKAERWHDVTYGLGAAYLTNATADAPHMRMLAELGLTPHHHDPAEEGVVSQGIARPRFWQGSTDPSRAEDFQTAWRYFERVRNSAYPPMPFEEGHLSHEAWQALDERTFEDEVRTQLGRAYHPHIEEIVRQYCWSAFGADSTEVSAAAGLNFLAADLGGINIFSGGNAAVAQRLVHTLRRELGPRALRSSCRVIDVRAEAKAVRVTYIDALNHLRTVVADACIVATPKFAAKKLIDDLPAAQLEAMSKLQYRAYLVANVLVDQPHPSDMYDVFCIAGEAPSGSLKDEVTRRPFTDLVLATFANQRPSSRTVLTLFRGLAYDSGRAELFAADSYEQQRGLIEPAVPAVVKALGLDPANIRDVRLTRWGHPLVMPKPGLVSSGVPERASAVHKDRVFFAQQDNAAMSSFESAFAAAAKVSSQIRALLIA